MAARAMARPAMAARRCVRASGASTMGFATARAFSTHVSVIGLHWKTDETRLRQAFAKFGKLEHAQVLTPDHSSSHLWASLVYSTFDEAFEAASEMNGQELDGRLLRVSIVDPPTAGETNDSEGNKHVDVRN